MLPHLRCWILALAVSSLLLEPFARANTNSSQEQAEENEFLGLWEGIEEHGQLFQMALCQGGIARLGIVGEPSQRAQVEVKFRDGIWEMSVAPANDGDFSPYILRLSAALVGLRMDRPTTSVFLRGIATEIGLPVDRPASDPVFLRRIATEADCDIKPRVLITHQQLVTERHAMTQRYIHAGGNTCEFGVKHRQIRAPGPHAKIRVRLERAAKTPPFGDFLTQRVRVENIGEEAIDFDTSVRLDVLQEALSPTGEWVVFENPRRSFGFVCGCRIRIVILPPGKSWRFLLPIYGGNYATLLRVRVETPLGTIYSEPFTGRVHREQLGIGIGAK